MSREFGSYMQGYFHMQIEYGADDCLHGRDPLTQLWGEFLKEFSGIAYAIASSEACDSGPDFTIIESINRMHSLERKLSKIKEFIEPYRRVAEESVRRMTSNEVRKGLE